MFLFLLVFLVAYIGWPAVDQVKCDSKHPDDDRPGSEKKLKGSAAFSRDSNPGRICALFSYSVQV